MLNDYLIMDSSLLPQTAKVIAKEFETAPFTSYLFPNEVTRREVLPLLFESLLTIYQEIGTIYITSPKIEGTFSLIPNQSEQHLSLYGHAIKTIPNIVKSLLHLDVIDTTKRLIDVQGQLKELLDYVNQQNNYFFLSSIAVKDPATESVFMKQLLSALIAEADQQRKTILVETETMGMVQLYIHSGFDLVKQVNLNENKVHLYLMQYEPKH